MEKFFENLIRAAEILSDAFQPMVIDGVRVSRIGNGGYRWETCIRYPDAFESWMMSHPDESSQNCLRHLWRMYSDHKVTARSFRTWSQELQRRIDFELSHRYIDFAGSYFV